MTANQDEISVGAEFKEIFAHMGAALAYFQLLELHLASTVAFVGLEHPVPMEGYLRFETIAQSLSYKELVKRYAEATFAIPATAEGLLKHAEFRNSLAHRFFVENAGRIYASSESRNKLCDELMAITDDLVQLSQALAIQHSHLCKQHGFKPRDMREAALAIVTGTANVFDRKVPVGSKAVIVSAYLLSAEYGDVPILQTAEGAKLFLTATGLEPASSRRDDDSDLRPYDALRALLPLVVVRRPKRSGPWHYDIRLGEFGAIEVRRHESKPFDWDLKLRSST
ncbi:MAG TPA: hypothetical protein VMD47_06125 [Candidatus Acidoferrales bacterium]|nr:hypothetical protein [Candidatus Acidoferrales bacterium]